MHSMKDSILAVCVYAVKLVRFMVLWVALFVTEKVYQDSYVSSVLIRDKPPPDLRPLVMYALIVDFVVFGFILMLITLLRAQNPSKTYVLDGYLVNALCIDYIASTLVIALIGTGLAIVVQDQAILRYRDDGLRSIRALGTLLLYCSMLTIDIPYFLLA